MSVREVVGGFKEMKITGKQLRHVVSVGAAQQPPVYQGTDLLALIKMQLILKKKQRNSSSWVLGFHLFCHLAFSTGSSEIESTIVPMITGFLLRGAEAGE